MSEYDNKHFFDMVCSTDTVFWECFGHTASNTEAKCRLCKWNIKPSQWLLVM